MGSGQINKVSLAEKPGAVPMSRGRGSPKMMLYACPARDSRIRLYCVARDRGLARAIDENPQPTGDFWNFHEYVARQRLNSFDS